MSKKTVKPTMAHLTDPYVLQLVEALADMDEEVESLEHTLKLSNGAFVAERAIAEELERKLKQCSHAFDDLEAASGAWEAAANSYKDTANENQRVAGRYQYLHEQAQRAINCIDDQFEYAYKAMSPEELAAFVHSTFGRYAAEVSKLTTKNKK